MRILAIESSCKDGSLAALTGSGKQAVVERRVALPGEQRTAQVLAPQLRALLSEMGWPPQSVELVAVSVGPGSFTGLRIGLTTAKTFAYAVGAAIIGVNSLEALAEQVPPSFAPLWAIMGAQRQELFAARFVSGDAGGLHSHTGTRVMAQQAWLAELQPGDRVTGPELRRLAARLPAGVTAVPEECWYPTATAVGMMAWQRYSDGQRDDVWKLVPAYYRPSAAEEKAARGDASGTTSPRL